MLQRSFDRRCARFRKTWVSCPKESIKKSVTRRITAALSPNCNITRIAGHYSIAVIYLVDPPVTAYRFPLIQAGAHMRITAILAAFGLVGLMAGSAIGAKPRKAERAPLLVAVTQCRTLTDSAARLACFDRSVAALDTAESTQTLVVIDQQQVRETRRVLFGITLPDTGLFGSGSDIPQIETTVASASVDDAGRWSFVMADGARWMQTDDNVIARRPRPNDKIVIKRAALGSFRLSVGGQPGVKAKRQN